jgi:hypothetical protein
MLGDAVRPMLHALWEMACRQRYYGLGDRRRADSTITTSLLVLRSVGQPVDGIGAVAVEAI